MKFSSTTSPRRSPALAARLRHGFEASFQYTANRYGATFNAIAEAHIQS